MRRTHIAAIAAAALIALGCSGAPDDDTATNPDLGATTSPAKPKKAGPKSWGDGDYRVGKAAGQIPAGEYATQASDDLFGCSWMRVKSFDGSANSYLAAGTVEPGSAGRMVVKMADYGVQLSGGCKWLAVKK